MNFLTGRKIISSIFIVGYLFFSTTPAEAGLDCGENGSSAWVIDNGPDDFRIFQTGEATCINYPQSRLIDLHGPHWVYSHAIVTDRTPYGDALSCMYTNPVTRPGFPPVLLRVGGHERCLYKPVPDENSGCGSGDSENMRGNPCNVASGNKFQTETDVSFGSLTFRRSYNSNDAIVNAGLGHGWRSNYQKALSVRGGKLTRITANGRGEPWVRLAGTHIWQGDEDSDVMIIRDPTPPWPFILTHANGASETYTRDGLLISETTASGFETIYSYDANKNLTEVTNQYGQSITFTYSDDLLSSVTDPIGAVYQYEYDANKTLVAVVLPDSTSGNASDNPRRIYHYEDPLWPYNLTGITDENGERFATWAYDDSNGKAVLSEHATTTNTNAQERFEFSYQGAN